MCKTVPLDTFLTNPDPSNHLSRRDFLYVAGLAAASAALSACAPLSKSSTETTRDQTRLVYQDWRTEWFPPMAQEMLNQFHKTHPDIRVFYVPDPVDVESSLIDDMRAGIAPDVFAACCSFFPILAQAGQALDLRPYVESDIDAATISDWDPAQYQALFTADGLQYGLPKYHGALALFFNRDLFDLYRVDYPDESWDYNDYHDAMRRLTQDRNGDGKTDLWGSMLDISWDRLQVHVNSWGGHFVDPNDPTRSLMAEPEALAALEWVRARIWDDRVMASPVDVQKRGTSQAFVEQYIAMVEDGSWALKDILSGAEFRIGVAPMPKGPARRATLATTDGFGIYAGTEHPREAWELLKFLISPEYGRAMAHANFLQPARFSIVEDWVRAIREQFPEKAKDVDIAVFADGQQQGYSVTAEVFENMTDAKRLAYSAWDQIFTLGQAPVDLMVDTSRQIESFQTITNRE